jgi:hypothetical protein
MSDDNMKVSSNEPVFLEMTNRDGEVGRLQFQNGIFHFEGDADETAKTFLERLNTRYQEMKAKLDFIRDIIDNDDK